MDILKYFSNVTPHVSAQSVDICLCPVHNSPNSYTISHSLSSRLPDVSAVLSSPSAAFSVSKIYVYGTLQLRICLSRKKRFIAHSVLASVSFES